MVREAIAALLEVDERIEGVECLIHRMEAADTCDLRRPQIYLRAALSEFVSMEEAAKLDFARLKLAQPPTLESLLDPRLHVVRLLRNANVHLSTTQLTTGRKPAIWDGPRGPQEFQCRLFLANDLEASVRATKGAARYSAPDLTAMINWLSAEQGDWGIQNVVLRAAEEYARVLSTMIPKGGGTADPEMGECPNALDA